jgi:hypothetical protein
MNAYRANSGEQTVACVQCGETIRRSDSYLSGDGPQCATCHGHEQVAELGRLALTERGVPASALTASGEVRWCPKCRTHSMGVTHTEHHTTKSFGGLLTTYSGRVDTFTCISCSHEAKLDNLGRFLWSLPGRLIVSTVILGAFFTTDTSKLDVGQCLIILVGFVMIGWTLYDVVQRLRHPRQ